LKLKPAALWTLEDLEKVIKTLKSNQSRDPNGMIGELFKPNIAGKDLKKAVIDLMNLVLTSFFMPEYLEYTDITSLFKHRGSRMELSVLSQYLVIINISTDLD
jgi:hypothetical protein